MMEYFLCQQYSATRVGQKYGLRVVCSTVHEGGLDVLLEAEDGRQFNVLAHEAAKPEVEKAATRPPPSASRVR